MLGLLAIYPEQHIDVLWWLVVDLQTCSAMTEVGIGPNLRCPLVDLNSPHQLCHNIPRAHLR